MACKRSRVRLPYPPLPLEWSRKERVAESNRGEDSTADSLILHREGVWFAERSACQTKLRNYVVSLSVFSPKTQVRPGHSLLCFACFVTDTPRSSANQTPSLTLFPKNMKVHLAFLAALALAFLLLMHNVRGLRTEKILKEGAVWQEVHIVWDWNKIADWGRENRPFQKR